MVVDADGYLLFQYQKNCSEPNQLIWNCRYKIKYSYLDFQEFDHGSLSHFRQASQTAYEDSGFKDSLQCEVWRYILVSQSLFVVTCAKKMEPNLVVNCSLFHVWVGL